MEGGLPEPFGTVLAAVYDVIVELGAETDDPDDFQHRFFKEVTRVELALLKQKADVALPTFSHPLPAMKTYRTFMCGAHIYEGLGDAKLRLRDRDIIEIRYWQCPYAKICKSRDPRICVRTHSLTEAAELLSTSSFDEIEDLRFSEAGNCQAFVRMQYTGDLREIEPEDRVIDERPCLHLTRDEAESFQLMTFIAGVEYGCNHIPDINVRQTLRLVARRIDSVGIDNKYMSEHRFLERGLSNWRNGKNAFTRNDD